MCSKMMFAWMMLGMLVMFETPGAEAQSLKDILPGLLKQVSEALFDNSEFELLGYYCNFSMTPSIKRFQLYYNGRVWCPGWTDVRGEASTRSRSGVVGKAIKDFLQKAAAKGIVTDAEVQEYLGS